VANAVPVLPFRSGFDTLAAGFNISRGPASTPSGQLAQPRISFAGPVVPCDAGLMNVQVGPLLGRLVHLQPLTEDHVDQLAAVAGEDRGTFGYALVPDGRAGTEAYVRELLQAQSEGQVAPFVQVRAADHKVVGATRFLALRHRPGQDRPFAVEIGGTWLAPSAQRSGINTEAKLLLMTYAFESWEAQRVDIKTDVRNDTARRAISALGTTFEGALRCWQPSQATGEEALLRDTAMYSVVAAEWPRVKDGLTERLSQVL
jgi:N-acetyltransferase